jgi:hypothetical protein
MPGMLLDRHRVARLIELTALERSAKGPERLLRESDVALFVKVAYDDASEAARSAFMEKVSKLPTSNWPWSAVQTVSTRGGGGGDAKDLALKPVPTLTIAPAALILLRAQVDTPEADPGNRIPARGTPEGAPWEPLYKALDAWETRTLAAMVGPLGWVAPSGETTAASAGDGATSGAPSKETGPAKTNADSPDLPAPTDADKPPLWMHPAAFAGGAAAIAVVTGVTVYAVARRSQGALERELRRQAEGSE